MLGDLGLTGLEDSAQALDLRGMLVDRGLRLREGHLTGGGEGTLVLELPLALRCDRAELVELLECSPQLVHLTGVGIDRRAGVGQLALAGARAGTQLLDLSRPSHRRLALLRGL